MASMNNSLAQMNKSRDSARATKRYQPEGDQEKQRASIMGPKLAGVPVLVASRFRETAYSGTLKPERASSSSAARSSPVQPSHLY